MSGVHDNEADAPRASRAVATNGDPGSDGRFGAFIAESEPATKPMVVLAPSSSTRAEQVAHAEKARSLPMTGEFEAVIDPSTLPDLPMPGDPTEGAAFTPASGSVAERWHQVIQSYQREAEALGASPKAPISFSRSAGFTKKNSVSPGSRQRLSAGV